MSEMIAERQRTYSFGGGRADGASGLRNLLGGKGANLAEMSLLGLPVPPGFTITTETCNHYYAAGRRMPEGLSEEAGKALEALETLTGKRFGDPSNPLLVSVRSGARASMPGMMDTVLNLGLGDASVEGLAARSGDRRFAWDSYRRFIQMYSHVVLGVSHDAFEHALEVYKDERDFRNDLDLGHEDWTEIVAQFQDIVLRRTGQPFPQDPRTQLWGAIEAVFRSWMNDRAIFYRKLHDIPESWGTAVTVQAMVFGNMGLKSATGVAFTRNPSTGENAIYGEFLINAQGEDVVAGLRTPNAISRAARAQLGGREPSMEEAMPVAFAELSAIAARLERHYRDMQDIEFTIEEGTLFMLQTRNGKRTTPAALRIAVDMVGEGLITRDEAILRIDAKALDQMLHPTISPNYKRDVLAIGLPASPGAAVGEVVFDPDEAATLAADGKAVILVRVDTAPEDIHGMHAARAIVTARGGMTSHAAVVARGMGRACVCGASGLRIDEAAGQFSIGGRVVRKGEIISVDGSTGQVLAGAAQLVQPELSGPFGALMGWADERRRLRVRANAETPADARMARDFGAEGIGLCRTEHMFFDHERVAFVREMILADSLADRNKALAKLLPVQRGDFEALFEIMGTRPVTIRLLDPPLHEFLPHSEKDIAAVAEATGLPASALMARAGELHESNPMLGHRGCRLGITFPEIYDMQARAIFEAAGAVAARTGFMPNVEIMIPLVSAKKELDILKANVSRVADECRVATGQEIPFSVGTMIELPRAALRAGDIALAAEFFSFGTNDLTQTTLGMSRDDARFLKIYADLGIYDKDPFQTLDQDGVGDLMRIALERGKAARPVLKTGICGEHGGDPATISFCEEIGLDYVSCSPFRVPIARLAAAQAAILREK